VHKLGNELIPDVDICWKCCGHYGALTVSPVDPSIHISYYSGPSSNTLS